MVGRYELSEAQWRRICDLLPGKAGDPGRPVRFILTAGQAHDVTTVPDLLGDLEAGAVIADRAYDTNAVRSLIAERGAQAVIPSTRTRRVSIPHDVVAYRLRNRIERFFN